MISKLAVKGPQFPYVPGHEVADMEGALIISVPDGDMTHILSCTMILYLLTKMFISTSMAKKELSFGMLAGSMSSAFGSS